MLYKLKRSRESVLKLYKAKWSLAKKLRSWLWGIDPLVPIPARHAAQRDDKRNCCWKKSYSQRDLDVLRALPGPGKPSDFYDVFRPLNKNECFKERCLKLLGPFVWCQQKFEQSGYPDSCWTAPAGGIW